MNISKTKLVLKFLNPFGGGIASVVEYLLDEFNSLIAKLPSDEVAKYAQLAKDIANFVANVANSLITNQAKKAAAVITSQAFADLAASLLDSKLTKEELDCIVEVVKESVEAWKKAK